MEVAEDSVAREARANVGVEDLLPVPSLVDMLATLALAEFVLCKRY
jgi:hypothetical protein